MGGRLEKVEIRTRFVDGRLEKVEIRTRFVRGRLDWRRLKLGPGLWMADRTGEG